MIIKEVLIKGKLTRIKRPANYDEVEIEETPILTRQVETVEDRLEELEKRLEELEKTEVVKR